MLLLYNNRLLAEEELKLPLTNRAFQYNDGFFETIIIRKGLLSFWPDHVQRMCEAATALNLQLPSQFTEPAFVQLLLDLAKRQQALEHGRLKLKVWRAGAGLYTPETNDVAWMATVQPVTAVAAAPLQVGICRQVYTVHSPISHFKGPNAPLYILAGTEKKVRNLDDMVLTDHQGNLAEFISSNICWFRNGRLYTPALATGCINGVMRRNILRWCRLHGVEVLEVVAGQSQLMQADVVFSANVTGIRPVDSIEGTPLPTQHPLLRQLQNELNKS